MSVIRWDPFRNLTTLQGRINRLFDESFPGSGLDGEEQGACAWRPNVDVYETETSVVVHADLPGVAKEDIGKVIGKQGNMARALRTIISNASTKLRKRAVLQILE